MRSTHESALFGAFVVVLCVSAGAGAAGSDVADAVMRGDLAAVRALVQKGSDVNAPQGDGATALHWAVYRSNVDAVDLLLRAGAKSVANREGMTPLAMAALYGHPAIVDRLLKAGADAKAPGPNGETMVMFAARNGNPESIKLLVEAGADVNAREPLRGTTALMWAIEQRHPEAVAALLAAGADPAARSAGAGLPRNYIAPRVNTRAVEEAQKRRERAAAAGRTYEEQLEFEYQNGQDLGGPRNAFTGHRAVVQDRLARRALRSSLEPRRSRQPPAIRLRRWRTLLVRARRHLRPSAEPADVTAAVGVVDAALVVAPVVQPPSLRRHLTRAPWSQWKTTRK